MEKRREEAIRAGRSNFINSGIGVLYREDGKKKIFKEMKMREGFSWGLCKDS